MELVVGISLITVVIGAIAVITTYSSRNSQFSKNQAQATRLAQENIEKVRTIKTSNYGLCFRDGSCSSWEEVWTSGPNYLKFNSECGTSACKFSLLQSGCALSGSAPPKICLQQLLSTAEPVSIPGAIGFTYEILISNEPGVGPTQKRVTSRVYWTDTTGQHSSDLVTVFSKI